MGRLSGLDTLRGMAALCVAVYHMSAIYAVFQPFGGGYLAVDFFFVLSGYVMARSYEGRGIEQIDFLVARLGRLWPVMAIGVMIGAAAHRGDPALIPIVLAGLLLTPVFITDQAFPVNNAAWSIFFELFANLVHSLALSRLNDRWLAALVGVLAVTAAFVCHRYGGLRPGPYTEAFAWGVPRTLLSYCIGILLFRKWRDRAPFAVPFVVAIALLPVLLTKPLHALAPGGAFDMAFVLLACPVLIAGALRHSTAWGERIGAISFPLYAVHYPVLTLAFQAGLPPLAGLAGALALAVLITYAQRYLHHVRKARHGTCELAA